MSYVCWPYHVCFNTVGSLAGTRPGRECFDPIVGSYRGLHRVPHRAGIAVRQVIIAIKHIENTI